MILSTLCYINKDNKVLMLYRNKKKNDLNKGKWIGIGGKLIEDESPLECIKRESFEETGLIIKNIEFKGIVTFIFENMENEMSFVYVAKDFDGIFHETCEGTLKWINQNKIKELNLWEGDYEFIDMLFENNIFDIKLYYDKDNKLVKVVHNE